MELNNKVVVITGGSKGFGKALAQAFKKEGSQVIISSNDQNSLESTAKELSVDSFTADVTSYYKDNLLKYLESLHLEMKIYGHEYEYNNPVLTLVDAVLSINRSYNNFVRPRIELVRKSNINTFNKLEKELSKGNESFCIFWNYNHIQRAELLKTLLEYFQNFQKENNIKNDLETLKEWGRQSSVEKYKEWNIQGIAFTTYQYLRMLCGADTVKPDIHILRIVEKGVGRKLSPTASVKIIEEISKDMNVKARDLDHAIWLYSSTK